MLQIIRITDDARRVVERDWLARAEGVHRQLRPSLPAGYVARMQRIFEAGGEMCVAVEEGQVVGVAVFRSFDNTHHGKRFYVDDLVTDEARRSSGVGHALLAFLEGLARARGGHSIDLDSGTHRTRAHRFYFREGFVIPSFVFRKDLP
ncbi:MAG TPA: GNAT family N-acetyltransferase [Burkholderiales bacterium]|nr:GNAT family N-acetyltransferase [Burkholderiales bacterium]